MGLSSLRRKAAEQTDTTHKLIQGETDSDPWNKVPRSRTTLQMLTRCRVRFSKRYQTDLQFYHTRCIFGFGLMRELKSRHNRTKLQPFTYTGPSFHVCFLLLQLKINHNSDTILKHFKDFFLKTDKIFPPIQIQIKYFKTKSFSGNTKPPGGLSMRQGVRMILMKTEGETNDSFHFAQRLIPGDT